MSYLCGEAGHIKAMRTDWFFKFHPKILNQDAPNHRTGKERPSERIRVRGSGKKEDLFVFCF